MIRMIVTLPQAMDRAQATQVVRAATHFQAQLMLEAGTHIVNVKSMLGVLSLAAGADRQATLVADGPDEQAAADKLAAMLAG